MCPADRLPIGAARAGDCMHTESVSHVYGSSSALQNAECPDDGRRHAILGLVDAEVLERPLGLGAPVLVGGHLDLAKGIAFGSRVGGHSEGRGMEVSLELQGELRFGGEAARWRGYA